MGLDVSGIIIVGEKYIPLSTDVKRKKFNEDTGEPYYVNEKNIKWVLEIDHTIIFDGEKIDKDLEVYYDPESLNEKDAKYIIVGLEISRTELRSDNQLEIINYSYLSETISKYNHLTGRLPLIFNFMDYC